MANVSPFLLDCPALSQSDAGHALAEGSVLIVVVTPSKGAAKERADLNTVVLDLEEE